MDNPYTYRGPLEGSRTFRGRSSELNRIASRIAAERPQSVSVLGPPQSGKSSLVNHLCDPEAQKVYLDDPRRYALLRLRLRYETPADPQGFFDRVARALAFVGEPGMTPSFDGFNEVVKRLMGDGRRLVLFLDDFGEVTRGTGFALEFFSFMRSVANSNDVGYLTTSSAPLQTLCHTQDIEESPFFNIFTTVNLEPFSAEEARKLVEEPAAGVGVPFGEEVGWILDLAGRHPHLLQLTASVAFEVRARAGRVGARELADLAFAEAREYLERTWKDLTEPQRQVLIAIGAKRDVDRRHEYAVESLERRGYLQKNGEGLAFVATLFKRYVEQYGGGKGFFRRLFG